MTAAMTDAAVTRMIRRILTAPTTCSDTLLVIADGLDDAAAHTDDLTNRVSLRGHADNLRRIAPYMAEPLMTGERAP